MFAILCDAVFACISAFAIIYALSFSFCCIFLSERAKHFSFKGFIESVESFIEREKNDGRS